MTTPLATTLTSVLLPHDFEAECITLRAQLATLEQKYALLGKRVTYLEKPTTVMERALGVLYTNAHPDSQELPESISQDDAQKRLVQLLRQDMESQEHQAFWCPPQPYNVTLHYHVTVTAQLEGTSEQDVLNKLKNDSWVNFEVAQAAPFLVDADIYDCMLEDYTVEGVSS